MIDVARFSDADRRDLFRNTGVKVGMSDSIAEKGFWVCYTLDYLFQRAPAVGGEREASIFPGALAAFVGRLYPICIGCFQKVLAIRPT